MIHRAKAVVPEFENWEYGKQILEKIVDPRLYGEAGDKPTFNPRVFDIRRVIRIAGCRGLVTQESL